MTETRENLVDRMLGLGSDPLPGRDTGVRLNALTAVVLAHACVETWSWVFELDSIVTGVVLLALGLTLSAGLWLVPRWRRTGLLLAAALTALQIGVTFPYVANHSFLRLIVMLLLALPGPRDRQELRLVHAAIGWTTAIVLFYTGFQKILHGTYFQGQYLAYMISFTDRFENVFSWLVPQAELERLRGIEAPVPGSGPFTVDAPLFLILSNLVYVTEIVLAALLLWPRTRRPAIWLTIGMLLVIELGAREVFFGLLFGHLLLALHPEDLNRRWLPFSLAVYALALLAKIAGWGGFFTANFSTKRRLVCVFLVVFAAWPLAHRALVASQSINPWRYGGWAMYCTPKLPVEVAIVPERDGQPVDLDLPQAVRDEAGRFAERRAVSGRFADPRALALLTLDGLEIDSVVVTLEHSRLDSRTNRVAARREYLRYSRDDEGRVRVESLAVRDLP